MIGQKIKDESKRLGREVEAKVMGYIAAGFGVVAGLAWNDAIKAAIDYLYPLPKDTLFARFIYAGFVTIAVVIVTVYITRILQRFNSHDKN